MSEWVRNGEFYFDQPVGPDSMSVVLKPYSTLHDVFAGEISRFSSAAIESAQEHFEIEIQYAAKAAAIDRLTSGS